MLEGHAPGLQAVEGEGEDGGRRRRRGRGGRGGRGDRPERGERAPREGQAQDEQPANRELFGSEAPSPRHEEPAPMHAQAEAPAQREPRPPRAERTTEPAETLAQKPVKPALVAPAPPAAFHAVIQHDDTAEEESSHKPVRKRRHGSDGGVQEAQPLQLVETQVEVPQPTAMEDDEPRRPVRRRRRGGDSAHNEPLMLVETQQSNEGNQPGVQP